WGWAIAARATASRPASWRGPGSPALARSASRWRRRIRLSPSCAACARADGAGRGAPARQVAVVRALLQEPDPGLRAVRRRSAAAGWNADPQGAPGGAARRRADLPAGAAHPGDPRAGAGGPARPAGRGPDALRGPRS